MNQLSANFQVDSNDIAFENALGIRYQADIFVDVSTTLDTSSRCGITLQSPKKRVFTFKVIPGHENFPVTYVTWYGAKAYCQWKYKNGSLPSEAQWEYAAKGGRFNRAFNYKYAGSNVLDSVGWFWDNAGFKPHEVGQKKPNQLGIYDMSGNLWEWIEDHWHGNYVHAPKDGRPWVDSVAPKDKNRVLRGGAWLYSQGNAKVTSRWSDVPDDRHHYKGFRCVCPS